MNKQKKIVFESSLLNCTDSKFRLRTIINNNGFSSKESFFLCKTESEVEMAIQFYDSITGKKAEIIKVNGHNSEPEAIYDCMGALEAYGHIASRLNISKNILFFGNRISPFISRFQPPKGVVCFPFYKVVLGTQCPFDCSYCYLQLTYRIIPYPRIYLNLSKFFNELRSFSRKVSEPIVLNAGELSDPLAFDDKYSTISEVIAEILKYPNIKLLLLSKSDKVDHLPDVSNTPGRIIYSASLTSPQNQVLFENGTASIANRIGALRLAESKGYAIRVRIDPIINTFPGWEKDYEQGLIKKMAQQISPEIITLGQPRFYPPLLRIARTRFPKQSEFWDSLISRTKDKKLRTSNTERLSIYNRIIEMIRDYYKINTPFIAFCKEDPIVIKTLNEHTQKICNCLPLSE